MVGGSLGARVLNETVPAALQRLAPEQRPQVLHQTGAEAADAVREAYARAGVAATVTPFVGDMAAALADCDGVVCRAGAVTVSELCAAGVASVLVPLIVSTTSHQRDNAQWMAGHGAAHHLPQAELDAASLSALLGAMDRGALQAMAERARALARPHAAARVADELQRLLPARRAA